MYTAGTLIYFDPFYFKDGGASKRKYFLVLKVIGENIIIASLPSSQKHLPANQQIEHGCLEVSESCINCYIFKANKAITKGGWSFELDTFLHGNWLDDYDIKVLSANYTIEGVDYEIIGELSDAELTSIIKCFTNSNIVKRKYKKMLSDNIKG